MPHEAAGPTSPRPTASTRSLTRSLEARRSAGSPRSRAKRSADRSAMSRPPDRKGDSRARSEVVQVRPTCAAQCPRRRSPDPSDLPRRAGRGLAPPASAGWPSEPPSHDGGAGPLRRLLSGASVLTALHRWASGGRRLTFGARHQLRRCLVVCEQCVSRTLTCTVEPGRDRRLAHPKRAGSSRDPHRALAARYSRSM